MPQMPVFAAGKESFPKKTEEDRGLGLLPLSVYFYLSSFSFPTLPIFGGTSKPFGSESVTFLFSMFCVGNCLEVVRFLWYLDIMPRVRRHKGKLASHERIFETK